jgi:hypothetical protein
VTMLRRSSHHVLSSVWFGGRLFNMAEVGHRKLSTEWWCVLARGSAGVEVLLLEPLELLQSNLRRESMWKLLSYTW